MRNEKPDLLSALRNLKLEEINQRLQELDEERASLSLLRRSIAARDRAKRRAGRPTNESGEAAR